MLWVRAKYDPNDPDANGGSYAELPNVDMVKKLTDADKKG